MSRQSGVLSFAVLALLASLVHADEGPVDEGVAGLNYVLLGDDWPGLCQTGMTQSPIDIPTQLLKPYDKPEYEPRLETLGVVENINVFATSTLPHVEVVWERMTVPLQVTLAAALDGNIFAPLQRYLGEGNIKRVSIEPAQFHFHTPSEALVDGKPYDGVLHIVNFVKEGESQYCDNIRAEGGLGCPVVISIFLSADDNVESSALSDFFGTSDEVLVTQTGKENGDKSFGQFNLDSLLPQTGNIATYQGSLTTAPCTEGVFWISLLTPLNVSVKEINQLRQTVIDAVAPDCLGVEGGKCTPSRFPDNNRITQPLNGRPLRIGNLF